MNYVRGVEFELFNKNQKRSWYSIYIYESNIDTGSLNVEITRIMPEKSKANPNNQNRIFLNGSNDLKFENIPDNISGDPRFDYNYFFSDPSDFSSIKIYSEEKNLQVEDILSIYSGRGGEEIFIPFAPNAFDDDYILYEDGAENLQSPSLSSQPNILRVLDNDIDNNGYELYITDIIESPLYGSAEIIDTDSDGLGDAILYTPYTDLGLNPEIKDSIKYYVNNGNGGTDFATASISLNAVADIPSIVTEIKEGENANETILRVYSSPNDSDGSEFVSNIELTSALPNGVTVAAGEFVEATSDLSAYRDYIIYTDLELNSNYDFNLEFTSISSETSNSDTESNIYLQPIKVSSVQEVFEDQQFEALRQSMWSSGDALTFDWNYTLDLLDFKIEGGEDVDVNLFVTTANLFEYTYLVDFYAGIEFYLNLSAGEVSAASLFDLTWNQSYNQTTDQLLIRPTAILNDVSFETIFANGKIGANFLYDVEVDFKFDTGDIDSNALIDIYEKSDGEANIFEYSTDDLELEYPVGETGLTISAKWPQVEVESSEFTSGSSGVSGTAESDDYVIDLNVDVDEVLVNILSYLGVPIDQKFISGEFLNGNVEYQVFDIDLLFGLDLIQSFDLQLEGIKGTIDFNESEEDSQIDFLTGQSIIIDNAYERFDLNGDGILEYSVESTPSSTLENDTDIGLDFEPTLQGPKLDAFGLSVGPLGELSTEVNLASFDVFESEFDFNFSNSTFDTTAPSLA